LNLVRESVLTLSDSNFLAGDRRRPPTIVFLVQHNFSFLTSHNMNDTHFAKQKQPIIFLNLVRIFLSISLFFIFILLGVNK
jgi:hypothetical protein